MIGLLLPRASLEWIHLNWVNSLFTHLRGLSAHSWRAHRGIISKLSIINIILFATLILSRLFIRVFLWRLVLVLISLSTTPSWAAHWGYFIKAIIGATLLSSVLPPCPLHRRVIHIFDDGRTAVFQEEAYENCDASPEANEHSPPESCNRERLTFLRVSFFE